MLGELYLFGCEPDVPYTPQEPWRAEVSEMHPSGKAAIANLSPRVEVATGSLSGERIGKFILTTRYVGNTIDMAETNFVVVYLHPYRDDEILSLEEMNEVVPSTGMSPPIGYCVLANRGTATNKFKLRLEDE
jgi:hypothetical protein